MPEPWRPNFKWNARATWVIAAIGIIAAIVGLIDHDLQWVIGGGVLAAIGLLLPRLRGRAKFGSPHVGILEGDIAPVGDPPKDERVTVVEPPDDPEQRRESAPPQA